MKLNIPKYPNYSFCTEANAVFRNSFGTPIKCPIDRQGMIKLKRDGVSRTYSLNTIRLLCASLTATAKRKQL
jgi:hypothetical protein